MKDRQSASAMTQPPPRLGEGMLRVSILVEVPQLLQATDNPIADIANSLGYAGASPFTRAFKRWTGMTPADWRRRNATGPASR